MSQDIDGDVFRRKYLCQIEIDGNFHADHVKMRRPEDDVGLTNGERYMVEDSRYQKHLAISKEPKQVVIRSITYFTFLLCLIY
jgi:hypothetical protein